MRGEKGLGSEQVRAGDKEFGWSAAVDVCLRSYGKRQGSWLGEMLWPR